MESQKSNQLPDIRQTQLLDFPIHKVWKAVATSEGIAAWFAPNDFQPIEGHIFQLDLEKPMGITPGKVTLVDPPCRLSYEWGKDWVWTFELNDLDGQTEFTFIYSGWDADKVSEIGMTHKVLHEQISEGFKVLNKRLARSIKKLHGE